MDPKLRKAKIEMWKEQLEQLEKQLQATMDKKGAAAAEGDLSENAAYTMAIEDGDTLRVQINQVKQIIDDLEKGVTK